MFLNKTLILSKEYSLNFSHIFCFIFDKSTAFNEFLLKDIEAAKRCGLHRNLVEFIGYNTISGELNVKNAHIYIL